MCVCVSIVFAGMCICMNACSLFCFVAQQKPFENYSAVVYNTPLRRAYKKKMCTYTTNFDEHIHHKKHSKNCSALTNIIRGAFTAHLRTYIHVCVHATRFPRSLHVASHVLRMHVYIYIYTHTQM